ncbi:MAG: hypothetical protein SGARI_005457, partial [Bacillariaceae sp.]
KILTLTFNMSSSSSSSSSFRGIDNVSNVSCHISCALQIVCHAVLPVRRGLRELAEDGDKHGNFYHSKLLNELVDFVGGKSDDAAKSDDDHSINTTDQPIWNPRQLYKHLNSIQGPHNLDFEEAGDPTTSLMSLLHLLGSIGPEWESLLKASIWEGQTRQILEGTKQSLRRIKTGKLKSMPCPLVLKPITVTGESSSSGPESLENLLLRITESQLIEGSEYPWDSAVPETYVERVMTDSVPNPESSDDEGDTNWTTTKRIEFHTIPRVLLLHVERPPPSEIVTDVQSQLEKNGNIQGVFEHSINIPLQIDTAGLKAVNSPENLVLQGAILQVVEIDDETTNISDDGSMEVHCV